MLGRERVSGSDEETDVLVVVGHRFSPSWFD